MSYHVRNTSFIPRVFEQLYINHPLHLGKEESNKFDKDLGGNCSNSESETLHVSPFCRNTFICHVSSAGVGG